VSNASETGLGELFTHTLQLEQYRPGFHNSNPTVRLTFPLTHSSLQRPRRYRLLRENSNEHSTLTTNILIGGNTTGFDCATGDVTCVQ
jgi:hypothetical protein